MSNDKFFFRAGLQASNVLLIPMHCLSSFAVDLCYPYVTMLVRSYPCLPCCHDIAPPPHPITLLFVYLVGLASRSACLGCYLYLLVVTYIFGAMVSGYLFMLCWDDLVTLR